MAWRSFFARPLVVDALESARAVVQAGCALHFVNGNVVEVTMCLGPSMMPTFQQQGDYVLTEHITPALGRLRVGDVVIARSPTNPAQVVCKRVLGREGDVIRPPGTLAARDPAEAPVVVPRGHVWLQGDNTANSTDSRAYGAVPEALVRGRVFYRCWPPSRAGAVPPVS